MGSDYLPLRNIGIYRNLPTFDSSITGLSAIITGANGISGFGTLRALLDSPERWTKIYTLSRRPPPESMMNLLTPDQRSRVQHVACDFLKSPDEIAAALKAASVQASHVFFYSYLQPSPPPGQPIWSNADELVKVNTALLSNFLDALPQADIHPKRILLQTGAKNYGVHLGRTRQPCQESDPQPARLAPNFYYGQEERLFAYCAANDDCQWNVVMPAWIVGAVANAAMNALHPFAVYAAVQARKGEPLAFPGTLDHWQQVSFHSSARLTGYLSEWIVLHDRCAGLRFNSTDSSPLTMDRLYERLRGWYGVEAGVTGPSLDESAFQTIPGPPGESTPLGYGPPAAMQASFSFVAWAQDSANAAVWRSMMDESAGKLTHDPFADPHDAFSCADAAWMAAVLSVDRAREFGWTGWVSSLDAIEEMYREMVGLGMLPEMVM